MRSSALTAPAPPDVTWLGLLHEVVADIRRLDSPGTNDAAFRSGTLHAIAQRLPPPPMPLDWVPSRLAPGATGADAAGMIYGHLAWHPGSATALFTRLTRPVPITITVICAAHRPLDEEEAGDLHAEAGARAYDRESEMTAGGVTVAWTRLILVRDRIPPAAWEAIQGGQPAGAVLAPYGMRRTRRDATLDRDTPAVAAAADLMLGDLPVGTAAEYVTPEFCEHAARLAGVAAG